MRLLSKDQTQVKDNLGLLFLWEWWVAPSNWFEGVGIVGAIRVHLDPSGNCTYNFSSPELVAVRKISATSYHFCSCGMLSSRRVGKPD